MKEEKKIVYNGVYYLFDYLQESESMRENDWAIR